MGSVTESPGGCEWIEVPPSALRGEGLRPYVEGEITNLFDWAENPAGTSTHLMPHRAQFIVDVVEIEANAVHQPSKPGDEIVTVLNGTLRLTDDNGGQEQEFNAGEMVLIPAGWAGMYRVIAGDGPFRELAIVPGDYFEPGVAPLPSGLSPRRLVLPAAPGVHTLHRARYAVEADIADKQREWTIATAADEIIRIEAGTLHLASTSNATAVFGAGSVVILPAGFSGTAQVTSGYRALVARWGGGA